MRQFLQITVASLVIFASISTASADWGHLTGRFVWTGDAPKSDKINVTKDAQFCGKHELFDESLVVDADTNGVSGIVIYISPARGKKAPKPHDSYAETANAKVRLDNLNCRFEPHVAVMRTSQTLVVGNKDTVGHNSQIITLKNPMQNPMIPANSEQEFKFPREERYPAQVKCSIHPWMTAYVVIKDTPYVAVTAKDGTFKIENLPTGKWSFQVWQGKLLSSVAVNGKKTRWSKGRFNYEIKAGDNDMGEINVTAATFK